MTHAGRENQDIYLIVLSEGKKPLKGINMGYITGALMSSVGESVCSSQLSVYSHGIT